MKTIPTAKVGGRGRRPSRVASGRAQPTTFREEVARFANDLPVLLAYVGADERHRVANRTYEEWFGTRSGGFRGAHLRDVLGTETYAAIRPHVAAVLRGQRVTFEMARPDPEGRPRFVEATWVPRIGADADVRGFFALLIETTAHKRAEEALRAIMEGTARATGDDFFQSLVTHLAAALDVSIAFVAEVTDATANTARVLAWGSTAISSRASTTSWRARRAPTWWAARSPSTRTRSRSSSRRMRGSGT